MQFFLQYIFRKITQLNNALLFALVKHIPKTHLPFEIGRRINTEELRLYEHPLKLVGAERIALQQYGYVVRFRAEAVGHPAKRLSREDRTEFLMGLQALKNDTLDTLLDERRITAPAEDPVMCTIVDILPTGRYNVIDMSGLDILPLSGILLSKIISFYFLYRFFSFKPLSQS